VTNVPIGLAGVTGISAGYYHSLAVKADGTVVAWGSNQDGETVIPIGLQAVAVAAGGNFSLALKPDGTVVAWGADDSGQAKLPAALARAKVIAIDAGGSFALAVVASGS
jgi:alpha-tubulin suppressor-like RCC1 family protein